MTALPDLGRIGIWSGALDALPVTAAAEAVSALEEAGFGAFWFGEAYGREAFTSALLHLQATRRMTIATGIASIYGRDAVAANAAARTLNAVSGGRFLLGLGVSHAPLVERMRGHSYGKPLAAMREYLDALDGATMYAAEAAEPAPRVLAALGPGMLALARDRAQGAHPYLVTPEHTAQARAVLGEGPLLAVEQAVCLATDEESFTRRAHAHLEIYTGLPNYRNNWLRQGFAESDFVRGGSDRLKAALVARGEDALQARVQEHLDAGADHVCVQVLADDAFTVPQADWKRVADVLLR